MSTRDENEYSAKVLFEALVNYTLTDVNILATGFMELEFTDSTETRKKYVEVWSDEEGNSPGYLAIVDEGGGN
jgi:hypothetical protein